MTRLALNRCVCKSHFTQFQNDKTSKMLDVHGDGKEIVKLPETPPYAVGVLDSGAIREPLIGICCLVLNFNFLKI